MKGGKKMVGKNILFVCSANVNRSNTAELWFTWRNPANNYSSAGSSKFACNKYGGKFISESDLENSDRIICMEKRNQSDIQKQFGEYYNAKIEVADIEDKFKFLDLDLIFECIDKIEIH